VTVAWILGSGGLLGSALCRVLRRNGTELFLPAGHFRWGDERELAAQLAAAVRLFAARAASAGRWEIYWAAGLGTMSSTEADVAPETRVLSSLLCLVETESQLMATPGAVAFASSAGAIYAGSSDFIVTENTPTAPTTAYAREKIRQEDLVCAFARAHDRKAVLLARLSTLYGPGQSFGKKQGLLAHIARRILRNQPINIYVPLDTIRDYITSDDAAADVMCALRAMVEDQSVLTKIVASEQPATIAEIISTFNRITRRAPRIIRSANRLTGVYSRRMRYQSIVTLERAREPRTSLPIGIARVMAAEREILLRGGSVDATLIR